jgi:hypothetical protein
LRSYSEGSPENLTADWEPFVRNRREQKARIHSLLSDFISIVEDGALYAIPADQQAMNNLLSDLGLFLQELVMDEIVSFKNPAFTEEREWRIVARPRLVEMQRARQQDARAIEQAPAQQAPAGEQAPASPIQYRHSKGTLIPYLSLSSRENGQLPIHSVRYGPTLEKFQTEYALIGFLIGHAYNHVRVVGSELPVKL